MNAKELAETLSFLARSVKTPASYVEFVPADSPIPRRKAITALAINGVVHHGLRLEITGPSVVLQDRPFYGLTAIMDAHISGRVWHLGRLEFDPIGAPPHHKNKPRYEPAPQKVNGPHFHCFEQNIPFGTDTCSKEGNLPVGYPFERKFDNFEDVLSATRERFVIPDLWMEDPACLILLA